MKFSTHCALHIILATRIVTVATDCGVSHGFGVDKDIAEMKMLPATTALSITMKTELAGCCCWRAVVFLLPVAVALASLRLLSVAVRNMKRNSIYLRRRR